MSTTDKPKSVALEHRQWNRDHVYWLEDIDRWSIERQETLNTLAQVASRLKQSEAGCTEHREAMVAHEQELAHHQQHLEKGDTHQCGDAAGHVEGRLSHEGQKEHHEVLNAKHKTMVELVNQLNELVDTLH